jgi:adenine-specific DNA-methyltransferase
MERGDSGLPGEKRVNSSESSSAWVTKTAKNQERPSGERTSTILPRRLARAELVWEGKYDAAGRRVAPLRVALPFQTVETVNESVQDRQRSLQFGPGFREEEWRNRLIWGDKKYVLPSLLSEFAGKVNLIYIDPPFDTGADFSFTATVPDHPDSEEDDSFSFTKEPSIIEHKAYRDIWGGAQTHLDAYLKWFYETAVLLHELLHEHGSIYVHCDAGVNSYIRGILDEIFGSENFRNEIVWRRANAHNDPNRCGIITDTIYYFAKSNRITWNQLYTPYSADYIESHWRSKDESGRRFRHIPLDAPRHGDGGNLLYEWKGKWPAKSRTWAYIKQRMEQFEKEGRLVYTKTGNPVLKRFMDETPGLPLQNLWDDIPPVNPMAHERVDYPTQKPEALLDRIIRASSNEGDFVLDCFCGSGTTAEVAEKLSRRWIACDLGRFAIHTTRKRLLSIPNVRPFVVQNLGKYERQLWAGAEFGAGNGGQAAVRQRGYIEFILKLAHATPLQGHTWLHGVKGGRMVHVGAVDAPVSVGDVTHIAAEFKRAIGTGKDAPRTNGIDVLGWDFAFELNEVAKQQAAAANIQMRFLRIPRDVMDKRAVEQGDIHFFELAALSVEVKTKKCSVLLKLKDFVIPPDDVPEEARKAVKHWSQWIDYWAVDWNNKGDTFHNEWQTYRTRQDKSLQLEVTNTYAEEGEYTVVVKVIDILGNDTTKTVKVRIA